MEVKLSTMRRSEQVAYMLRGMYEGYGYAKFRMGKFEAYDFYTAHRDFLSGGPILTFTDLSGKLMALQPDISINIAKRTRATMDCPERLYYTESVYRASRENREFKEIFQIGVEYIGDVTPYTNVEVLSLAAKSLACIKGEYLVELSHMGFLTGLLDTLSTGREGKNALLKCLESKNSHALFALMEEQSLTDRERSLLQGLCAISGGLEEGLKRAERLVQNAAMEEALNELRGLHAAMQKTGMGEKLHLDFSIALNSKYYNGLIFRGYINGVPRAVVSGGRYDPLLRRMGKKELMAIGFAVYFDEVERVLMEPARAGYDAVVLYGADADASSLHEAVEDLIAAGNRVYAGRCIPKGAEGAAIYTFNRDGLKEAEQ